jgi:hypothetical protein
LHSSADPSFLRQFAVAAAVEIGEMLDRAGHRAAVVLIITEPEPDGEHRVIGTASLRGSTESEHVAHAREIVDRAWKTMHAHKPGR